MKIRWYSDWLSQEGDSIAQLGSIVLCDLWWKYSAFSADGIMDRWFNEWLIARRMCGYVLVANKEKRYLVCEMSLFMYVSIIEIEGW